MYSRSCILSVIVMFLSFSRKVVAFRLPSQSMIMLNRNYTHQKNKMDVSSHLYKAKVESQGDRPKPKKVDKIVVDPKNDYKFRECRVFVDNIPLQATWKDLKDHFREAGVNYVSISKDPATGESKGCGIVQFDSVEQARKVVADMQGSLLKGSPLKVWLDRKMEGGVAKTIHSLPNSSKLRGDIKSSSEFEAFKRERNGKNSERNDRDGRDSRPAREDRDERSNSRDRDTRVNDRDGDRGKDSRPVREGRDERRNDGVNSRSNERTARTNSPTNPASADGQRLTPLAQDEPSVKFTPSFFKRDADDHTEVPPERLSEIEFLVDTRADCRDYGNYKNADEIRLKLRNDFLVQCDDVKKTWRILSPLLPDGTPRPNRAR